MEPDDNQQVIELLQRLIDRLKSGETVVEHYELKNLFARRMAADRLFYENVPNGSSLITLHLYSPKSDKRDGSEIR